MRSGEDAGAPGRARRGLPRVAVLLALALLVAGSTAFRARGALADEAFREGSADGLLRSDPALLLYLLGRVLDAGGGVPSDFRADPRVEHPLATDVPAEFAVGQEFLLAWAYLAFGDGVPLHVFCVAVMSAVASLVLIGAWLLAREWTGSDLLGLFAAALLALLPATYRTVGFVLMREDLSFPLFALHLGLAARATRRGGARRWALAALPLGLSLATWHAAGFLLGLEMLAVLCVSLARGRSLVPARGAWAAALVLAALSLAVPVLRSKAALLSPPVLSIVALAVAASLPGGAARYRALLAGSLALLVAAGRLAASAAGGPDDYAHVADFALAKLLYLGRLPPDPRALSFDARLLWQGPFATLDVGLGDPATWLHGAFWIAVAVFVVRRRADPAAAVLGAFALVSLGAGILVQRVVILPALLGAAWAGGLAASLRRGRAWAAAALVAQGALFAGFARAHEVRWLRPVGLTHELGALVRWCDRNLPPDAVVLGDFVTSPAILAHTGRAIVLQPKYEAGESRARARAFLDAFFHGTPEDLRRLARERFGATHLVVDRYTLGTLSRYLAGLPPGRGPAPGTPAALFCDPEREPPASLPGYRLAYRSTPIFRRTGGRPLDLYRVYALEP